MANFDEHSSTYRVMSAGAGSQLYEHEDWCSSDPSSIRVTVNQPDSLTLMQLVWDRKNTHDHLQAMENRVRSLQLAALKADKKLEEAKKLVSHKLNLKKLKLRDEEMRNKMKETMQSQVQEAQRRVMIQREEMREKLQMRRKNLVQYKRSIVAGLKNDVNSRMQAMQATFEQERGRKVLQRVALTTSLGIRHKPRTQSLEEQRRQQHGLKREEEKKLKTEMERRIRELRLYEHALMQSVRDKYQSQAEELARLEELITRPKEQYRRVSTASVG